MPEPLFRRYVFVAPSSEQISRRGFKGRLKIKPVRLTLNLKVGNHRIIRRSVNTRMDVRKMRCIDKVFDHARSAGFPGLGTVEKSVIVRIFNFPGFRYRRSWLVQAHPYKVVLFLSPVDHNPRLLWDAALGWKRWNTHACSIRRIGPTVIGTREVTILNPAKRKRRSTMNAQVFKRYDLLPGTPQGNSLVEQANPDRLLSELITCGYWVPVVSQDSHGH